MKALLGVLLLVGGIAVAVVALSTTRTPSGPTPDPSRALAATRLACTSVQQLQEEVASGSVVDDQIAPRLRLMYERYGRDATPRVADTSRKLASAAATGEQFEIAWTDMRDACAAAR